MKTTLFATAAAAVLLGTAVFAAPIDDIVAMLKAEGYTKIEVESEGANTEIEGKMNGTEREILIVTATGEVLSDKVETEDSDEAGEKDDDKS